MIWFILGLIVGTIYTMFAMSLFIGSRETQVHIGYTKKWDLLKADLEESINFASDNQLTDKKSKYVSGLIKGLEIALLKMKQLDEQENKTNESNT